MVPRIHQYLRLWAGVAREKQRHAPIAQVRVIEIRLKWLVFHQHTLLGGKVRMRLLQALCKPLLPMANGSCPRIARTVGEPERDVLATRLLANLDTFQNVIERGLANFRVGIAQRPILVNLVLENIGVDRAEANAGLRRRGHHRRRALEPLRKIPKDVRCHTGTAARVMMHLPRIA